LNMLLMIVASVFLAQSIRCRALGFGLWTLGLTLAAGSSYSARQNWAIPPGLESFLRVSQR